MKMLGIFSADGSGKRPLGVPPSAPAPAIRPPELPSKNPRYPSFSASATVEPDSDKGRKVVATEDVALGELVMVEKPNTLFFCPPENKISLLKTHCVNCMRWSPAPIPCEDCCVVCFCSLACRDVAKGSYHKYECKMKLYEMLHFMGDDYIDVFMAIRSVTQRPCSYFMDRADELWGILDLEYPELIIDEAEPWEPDSVESVLRLMGHQRDIDESQLLTNAVVSVFFLRALQAAGYFHGEVPRKHPGDRRLREPEKLILCVLNHLVNIQHSNAEPFTRLVGAAGGSDEVYFQLEIGRKFFAWERIGSCVSSGLALVNHSCDANSVRFFCGDHIVLAAARNIRKGEEITISYGGIHHENSPLFTRQLELLRRYHFACECPACQDDWCQYEAMPDNLFHVPNFETEKHFRVRTGDKKDLVSDIDRLKLKAEREYREGRLEEAVASLDDLSALLEGEINKPHQYHIQTNQAARLCVKSLYMRTAIEEIRDVDFTTRGVPPKFADGKMVTKEEEEARERQKQLKRKKSVKRKKREGSLTQQQTSLDSGMATPDDAAAGITYRDVGAVPEVGGPACAQGVADDVTRRREEEAEARDSGLENGVEKEEADANVEAAEKVAEVSLRTETEEGGKEFNVVEEKSMQVVASEEEDPICDVSSSRGEDAARRPLSEESEREEEEEGFQLPSSTSQSSERKVGESESGRDSFELGSAADGVGEKYCPDIATIGQVVTPTELHKEKGKEQSSVRNTLQHGARKSEEVAVEETSQQRPNIDTEDLQVPKSSEATKPLPPVEAAAESASETRTMDLAPVGGGEEGERQELLPVKPVEEQRCQESKVWKSDVTDDGLAGEALVKTTETRSKGESLEAALAAPPPPTDVSTSERVKGPEEDQAPVSRDQSEETASAKSVERVELKKQETDFEQKSALDLQTSADATGIKMKDVPAEGGVDDESSEKGSGTTAHDDKQSNLNLILESQVGGSPILLAGSPEIETARGPSSFSPERRQARKQGEMMEEEAKTDENGGGGDQTAEGGGEASSAREDPKVAGRSERDDAEQKERSQFAKVKDGGGGRGVLTAKVSEDEVGDGEGLEKEEEEKRQIRALSSSPKSQTKDTAVTTARAEETEAKDEPVESFPERGGAREIGDSEAIEKETNKAAEEQESRLQVKETAEVEGHKGGCRDGGTMEAGGDRKRNSDMEEGAVQTQWEEEDVARGHDVSSVDRTGGRLSARQTLSNSISEAGDGRHEVGKFSHGKVEEGDDGARVARKVGAGDVRPDDVVVVVDDVADSCVSLDVSARCRRKGREEREGGKVDVAADEKPEESKAEIVEVATIEQSGSSSSSTTDEEEEDGRQERLIETTSKPGLLCLTYNRRRETADENEEEVDRAAKDRCSGQEATTVNDESAVGDKVESIAGEEKGAPLDAARVVSMSPSSDRKAMAATASSSGPGEGGGGASSGDEGSSANPPGEREATTPALDWREAEGGHAGQNCGLAQAPPSSPTLGKTVWRKGDADSGSLRVDPGRREQTAERPPEECGGSGFGDEIAVEVSRVGGGVGPREGHDGKGEDANTASPRRQPTQINANSPENTPPTNGTGKKEETPAKTIGEERWDGEREEERNPTNKIEMSGGKPDSYSSSSECPEAIQINYSYRPPSREGEGGATSKRRERQGENCGGDGDDDAQGDLYPAPSKCRPAKDEEEKSRPECIAEDPKPKKKRGSAGITPPTPLRPPPPLPSTERVPSLSGRDLRILKECEEQLAAGRSES